MCAETDYQRCLPAIKAYAWRVYRRAQGAGAASLQIEDIIQELSIAWMRAAERWNPQAGVPFLAYLNTGMRMHINQFAKGMIDEALLAPESLDRPIGDTDGVLGDVIADEFVDPDQALMARQAMLAIQAQLSPRARQFVELLADPPAELSGEITALQAKSVYARTRGVDTAITSRLTTDLIFTLMGAERGERNRIMTEIRSVLARVSQS